MPDCRPHSGMLFCQLDSHSTRPSLPHVLLHPPCQHVWPSEQPFVVVAQMKLLYTSFHYCCIPHNKSTINMHIHICTDYSVFPVELCIMERWLWWLFYCYSNFTCYEEWNLIPAANPPSYPLAVGEFRLYTRVFANSVSSIVTWRRSYGTEMLHKVMKLCTELSLAERLVPRFRPP